MAYVRILEIDGGGIRGLIPIEYIIEFEKLHGKPFLQNFHVTTGTSTAAFILFGLASSVQSGKRFFSPEEIKEKYIKFSPKIFRQSKTQRINPTTGTFNTKFGREGIDITCRAVFGDLKLSDINEHIIISAFNVETQEPFLFSTEKAKQNPDKYDYYVRDVVAATTAAPSYLPGREVKNALGEVTHLIDGGTFDANTTAFAIGESFEKFHRSHKWSVLSLGTGVPANKIDLQKSKTGGKFFWAPHIWDAGVHGKSKATVALSQVLFNHDFHRINTPLVRDDQDISPSDKLDVVNDDNIKALIEISRLMFDDKHIQTMTKKILKDFSEEKAPEDILKKRAKGYYKSLDKNVIDYLNEMRTEETSKIKGTFNGNVVDHLLEFYGQESKNLKDPKCPRNSEASVNGLGASASAGPSPQSDEYAP